METGNFYLQVCGLLDQIFLNTGYQLDVKLTGYSLLDAVHINIDPAMQALVRTERRISNELNLDLRELVNVHPPVSEAFSGTNQFITFSAESAQFLGGNASAFGIHLTEIEPSSEIYETLDSGLFIPGTQVINAYRLVTFLRTPAGDVSLTRTGVTIGLDQHGQLVAYQTFHFNPGLTINSHVPSTLSEADPQVMLYVFLTLTIFLMLNQGETVAYWEDTKSLIIG